MKKRKKTESGRSMIEMVGVLAMMGLITAGAFVLISSAMSAQKISRMDDDVSAIVAGVRLLYNTSDTFDGLSDDIRYALKVSGNNPYNGTYGLAVNNSAFSWNGKTYKAKTTFFVTIDGLTDKQCTVFVSRSWPVGAIKVEGCSSKTSCGGCGTVVRVTYGRN